MFCGCMPQLGVRNAHVHHKSLITASQLSRMPSGLLTALKVAPPESWQERMLRNEHAVSLAASSGWGRHWPALLAAGLCKGSEAYVIATEFIDGRPLDPAVDAQLLLAAQEALDALHSLGIAHSDLRPANWIVQQPQGGEQRLWLLDFSHSRVGASQQEMQADEAALLRMFNVR